MLQWAGIGGSGLLCDDAEALVLRGRGNHNDRTLNMPWTFISTGQLLMMNSSGCTVLLSSLSSRGSSKQQQRTEGPKSQHTESRSYLPRPHYAVGEIENGVSKAIFLSHRERSPMLRTDGCFP